jgi:hypothetical protein
MESSTRGWSIPALHHRASCTPHMEGTLCRFVECIIATWMDEFIHIRTEGIDHKIIFFLVSSYPEVRIATNLFTIKK